MKSRSYLEMRRFFVLVDLRQFLRKPTFEEEMVLWRKLVDECNVVFTPGCSMHCDEPGWYRCCYAAYDTQSVEAALERTAKYLWDYKQKEQK